MNRAICTFIFLSFLWSACRKQADQLEYPVSSQVAPPPLFPTPHIPYRLDFKTFTTADGLPSNAVLCMLQDRRGFLWVGTENGVCRYDGYQFETAHTLPNDTLSTKINSAIKTIFEDSRGNIWGVAHGGMQQIDPQSLIATSYPDTAFLSCTELIYPNAVIDRHDRIWISSRKPVYFDARLKVFKWPNHQNRSDSIKTDHGYNYVLDPTDGEIYGFFHSVIPGASKLSQLHVFRAEGDREPKLKILHHLKGLDSAKCLPTRTRYMDRRRQIWMDGGLDQGEIFRYNIDEDKMYEYPVGMGHATDRRKKLAGTVYGIQGGRNDDYLWITGYGTLQRFEPVGDSSLRLNRYVKEKYQPYCLPAVIATGALEDRTGNLWVSTMGGLSVYAPSKHKFEHYYQAGPDSTRLIDPKIDALSFDSNNRLWVGTENGLCLLANREKKQFKHYPQQKSYGGVHGNIDRVTGLYADSLSNSLYICYWGSYPNRINLDNLRYEELPIRNLSQNNWIEGLKFHFFQHQVTCSPNGVVFYADWDGFLCTYNPTAQHFQSMCPPDAGKEYWSTSLNSCLWIDDDQHIWLGNDQDQGLQYIDFTRGSMLGEFAGNPADASKMICKPITAQIDVIKPFPNDSTRLTNGSTNFLYRDKKGRLWVGTKGGLFELQDRSTGQCKRFDTQAGFPSVSMLSVQEDAKGRLWIATDQGICRFEPDLGKVTAVFDIDDGLQGNEFENLCSAQNSYGLMAFGGANGFNVFHPDSIYNYDLPPVIEFLSITANKTPKYIQNGAITVPYDSSTVFIKVAAMDFAEPEANLFQYRIEGYENEYSDPSPNNEIRYINLPPGKHRLHIMACNHDGIWNYEGAWLTIIVKPPFWQTWWFVVCVTALLFFAAYRYFRWRESVARRNNLIDYLKVQSLQAQLNPHFLFNVLATMQSRILNNDPQQASKMVVDLAKLMRNFLEATIAMDVDKKTQDDAPVRSGITSGEITLAQELELLEMYIRFEQMKYENKFQYQIKYDRMEIVPGNETLPPLLLQPYVENAIKHGLLPRKDNDGLLILHFYKDDHYLVCRIEDNGIGIEKSIQQRSGGILLHRSRGKELVERRVNILNQGKYHITISPPQEKPGGGAVVTVMIGYQ